jgi:predicted DsbA family dithiol-disulfide isomerase
VVEVEYFTDPLCCWSWAFEPQWRALCRQAGTALRWRLRLGGLVATWVNYTDPINSICRPSQMAPLWFHVSQLFSVPLDEKIWLEDPPPSSYPACAAVKAAELQSPQAADLYLLRLRKAVTLERRNIARREELLRLATDLGAQEPDLFDAERFAQQLHGPAALELFREDLQRTSYLGIDRFPTLVMRRIGEQAGIQVKGYRPYEVLQSAFDQLAGSATHGL